MPTVRRRSRLRGKRTLESGMFSQRKSPYPDQRLRTPLRPTMQPSTQVGRAVCRAYLIATIATVFALTPIIASCGNSSESESSDSGPQSSRDLRIVDAPETITVDDLTGIGMKVGKDYDVETLEGATSSNLLFWRVNDTAVEYEVRFYQSHADAVNLGTAPAQEGSGPDAIIDVDIANYKEGIRDRRTIFDFRAEPKPKYGAYGIYANIVMLCEGRDDAEAWSRCQALIDQISAN